MSKSQGLDESDSSEEIPGKQSRKIDTGEIRRKSVRGGFVSMLSQGAGVLIQLASTIILARLLLPSDYGTIAMVLALTGFAALFRDLGLSSAAIQKDDLSKEQQSNLFWINVATGLLLTILVSASAPLVAKFYNKPELLWVTVALSFSFIITSFGAQHGAMLIREMKFGKNALSVLGGAAANLSVAVVLAYNGWAYWALVWGTLVGAFCSTSLLLIFSPFKPGLVTRNVGTRELIGFGANVTAFNFVNYFSRNLDNILIGRFWGTEILGLYTRAYQLLMFPVINLRGPVHAVAFPAMSRLESKGESFRSYYCKVISLLAFGTMPLMAWLYISSDEIISLVLGPKWLGVVPIFSILAITGFIQPVSSMRGVIMLASGQSKKNLMSGLVTSVVVSIAFAVGVTWGAEGVAWAYAIAIWSLAFPMHCYSVLGTSIKKWDLLNACKVPLVISIMGLVVNILLLDSITSLDPMFKVMAQASVFILIGSVSVVFDAKSRRLFVEIVEQLKR